MRVGRAPHRRMYQVEEGPGGEEAGDRRAAEEKMAAVAKKTVSWRGLIAVACAEFRRWG